MDDLAALVEGHHPVGHVEEEGGELGPLALHLLQGGLELADMALKALVSTPISSWDST